MLAYSSWRAPTRKITNASGTWRENSSLMGRWSTTSITKSTPACTNATSNQGPINESYGGLNWRIHLIRTIQAIQIKQGSHFILHLTPQHSVIRLDLISISKSKLLRKSVTSIRGVGRAIGNFVKNNRAIFLPLLGGVPIVPIRRLNLLVKLFLDPERKKTHISLRCQSCRSFGDSQSQSSIYINAFRLLTKAKSKGSWFLRILDTLNYMTTRFSTRLLSLYESLLKDWKSSIWHFWRVKLVEFAHT